MFTATPPPLDSKIEHVVHDGKNKYFWKEKDSPACYLLAILMSLPVFVYLLIIRQVASQAIQGPAAWEVIMVLLFFIGGVVPLLNLIWLTMRPAVPESITLDFRSLQYDSGVPRLNLMSPQHQGVDVTRLPRRTRFELRRDQKIAFELENVEARQRLRVDMGAQRIEIGEMLTESEREWLHGVLTNWQKG